MNRKLAAVGLLIGFGVALAIAATTKVDSLSVAGTNTVREVVVTNGVTLGGVRLTAWPSGTGDLIAANGMTNLAPLLGAGGVAVQSTNAAGFRVNVGLGNVDNTSDANKPISSATQTALDGKVNKAGDSMTGPLSVTALTNSSLTPSRLMVSAADKSEASVTTTGLVDGTGAAVTVGSGLDLTGGTLTATGGGGGVAMSVSNNVASAGLLAVDATKTNGIAATGAHVNTAIGGGAITVGGLTNTARTASTFVVAAADKSDVSTAASSVLATTLSDETGTGKSVFNTSPIFNTSITITNDTASQMATLFVDAANTLALRNAANAQTFNIYNTYTDASNYERAYAKWSSSVFEIGTEGLGTGTGRQLKLTSGSAGNAMLFRTGATDRWILNASGHIVAVADNAYDIGASGATRPRNVYIAGTLEVGGTLTGAGSLAAGAANRLLWNGRSAMTSPADGQIRISNAAQTDFDRLQFGGTSASFPSLKRSTTNLVVRLADDSGDSSLTAFSHNLSKTITAAGTTGDQTIHKASGSVNFAAAAQTITVTDNIVDANSVITATVATDDTTAKSVIAVPGAGSFVLKLNAAATAETRVSFRITN